MTSPNRLQIYYISKSKKNNDLIKDYVNVTLNVQSP